MNQQDPGQYYNYVENRPPDILGPGPDLVVNSASNQYLVANSASNQYLGDHQYIDQNQYHGDDQMYANQYHYQQQFYNPHYYQQPVLPPPIPIDHHEQVPLENQQREPVDGGNEAIPSLPPAPIENTHQGMVPEQDDNLSMPMERLVLGESEDAHPPSTAPPPPMFSPIFPPPMNVYPSMPYMYNDQTSPGMIPGMYQPSPPVQSYAPPPPSSDRFVAGEANEQDRIVMGNGGERVVTGTGTTNDRVVTGNGVDRIVTGNGGDRIVAGDGGSDEEPDHQPPELQIQSVISLTPSPTPLAPPPSSERSEAAGSERRDESVMGPPPTSGLSPPPSTRRDIAGSDAVPVDRKPKAPPPPKPNLQPKPPRKEEYQYDSRKSDSDDERDDGSVFSHSSEVPHQQPNRVQPPPQQQRRGGSHKNRPESLRHNDSSSDLEERVNNRPQKSSHNNTRHEPPPHHRQDSYRSKRDNRYHDDRRGFHDRRTDRTYGDERGYKGDERGYKGDERGYKGDERGYKGDERGYKGDERGYKGDERSYRDERSFREDRTFRDDRSFHGDRDYRRERGNRDRDRPRDPRYETARKDPRYTPSRPSSRAGSYFAEDQRSSDWYYRRGQPEYMMDQSFSYSLYHPYSTYPGVVPPYYPQPQAPALDPATLETFRKNWEYYERNPKEKENLRLTNPAKFDLLITYYKSYGHLLPQLPPPTDRPSSRASVHSGQSSVQGIAKAPAKHETDYNWLRQNESTILPPDPSLGTSNYQPTLEESDVYGGGHDIDESSAANYDQAYQYQVAPLKFSSPCVRGIFSPQGILIKIDAKSPLDGQNATVELHSLQALLGKEFKELKNYPGPLVPGRTHKGEVIQFCQTKISSAKRNRTIVDRESYILIWELLILLMRQKNTIDGSDIAELLLKDRRDIHLPYSSQNAKKVLQDVIDDEDELAEPVDPDQSPEVKKEPDTDNEGETLPFAQELERTTSKFRDYLLFGHKKEALEYAMKQGLWGHALFLASKLDERTYSGVMLRFANGLAVNDPLQTLYQLMSGRQPIAVKECADQSWGDWRPHLAMILSNAGDRSDLYRKSILTLGDTLLEKGLLYGAHFCYLVGSIEFGTYSNRNSKLVLIGSDHRLPFDEFATNEAIQCSEIFEYAQKLSNSEFVMHTLTYYKFTYIIRLLDSGRAHKALHYIEELSKMLSIHSSQIEADQMDPRSLINQLLVLAEHLKYKDPMYTTGEGEIIDMGEPQWLINFRNLVTMLNSSDWTGQAAATSQLADSTDAVSYQEGQVYQQDYQDPNQYYDPYQQQQQQQQAEHQQEQSQDPTQAENNQDWNQQSVPDGDAAGPLFMKPISEEDHSQAQTGSQPESSAGPSSINSSAHPSPVHAPFQQTFQPPSLPPLPASPPQANYFANIAPPVVNKLQSPSEPAKKEANEQKAAKPAEKKPAKSDDKSNANSSGLFGKLLGKIGLKTTAKAHLPDDKDQSIVWDPKTKRWIDKNASEDEASQSSMAPPSDIDLSRSNSSATFPPEQTNDQPNKVPLNNNTLAPPMGQMGNKYVGGFGKKYGGSLGRIDVFKASQSSPSLSTAALPPLIPTLAPIAVPGMLTPDAAPTSNGTAPSSPVTSEPINQGDNSAAGFNMYSQEQVHATENWNGGQPVETTEQQQANGPQSWGAPVGEADQGSEAPPLLAPMFFNPTQFSGPVPTTRRNKYA